MEKADIEWEVPMQSKKADQGSLDLLAQVVAASVSGTLAWQLAHHSSKGITWLLGYC